MDRRNPQPKRSNTTRLMSSAVSVALHGALLYALLSYVAPPAEPEPPPVVVTMVPPPVPAPTAEPAAAAAPAEIRPPPQRAIVKAHPPPPDVKPVYARTAPVVAVVDTISDALLAGALTAGTGNGAGGGDGSGDGNGACNMVRRMQAALRKDPLVRQAVAEARHGGAAALLVWNGDWVQSRGEEGKGLAAVRQAMVWEVAFAPPACRAQAVRGMVLITMNEGPGAGRVAFGEGSWRWSDLLAR